MGDLELAATLRRYADETAGAGWAKADAMRRAADELDRLNDTIAAMNLAMVELVRDADE